MSSDGTATPGPPDERESEKRSDKSRSTNYELEGYKAGLQGNGYRPYDLFSAANEQWTAGYIDGLEASRGPLGIPRAVYSMLLFGLSILFLVAGATLSLPSMRVPRVENPGTGAYPPTLPTETPPAPIDQSRIDMKLDKLASAVSETCQPQMALTQAKTNEVQASVTSDQRPLFTAAITGVLDTATKEKSA
ncbi:hypothetical protein AWB67_07253 [Caballeronia terrestris]|uniref:Uncharacterized protein n=1 Tax=Caballeronia terrestris TaxID=1226301 RepID=A0A158KZU0_9BURK|nr:hypothetical protein [Caballeronia terrestris]SAL86668.1 hypothetical protein AWB67_07253 [Caballeronia terrestris]